jgi:serine/threonine protein kinase
MDNFIQETQLKMKSYGYGDNYLNVLEWIPYNQFDDIKEIGKGGFATVYSATWKDGPLKYNYHNIYRRKWNRVSNKKVALKCLHNSQNIMNTFLNEVNFLY